MSRITTSIGLVTGMPITDTVDQLMALQAKSRDILLERTVKIKEEQIAVTELSALLISTGFVVGNLSKEEIYRQRQVTSGNDAVLSATITGNPPKGIFQFTPVRMAQHQQMLGSGIRSDSDPIGAGKITFRFGDNVERNAPLDLFGGGQGVARGQIRVTDRSGASAQVDLTTVQTVDDVLEAINRNIAINVTAVANGDRIRLIDNTGQSLSNLMVQEVGGGRTAASLGLDTVNTASLVGDGRDMLWLTDDTQLEYLNDGAGVHRSETLPDVSFHLRDGTQGTIDLSPINAGGSDVEREFTLGEILDAINAAEPEKLRVEIAADGERLTLIDMTEGSETFRVESFSDSSAAEDLGLVGESTDGTIVGRRLLGGMKSVLLSSLNGGQGFGELGALELTDAGGATDTVSLASAETLEDVIHAINAADVDITASVNAAKNGVQLTDSSGAEAGNLIVASADGKRTAEKLQLDVDAATSSKNAGDLHLRVVSRQTRLEDLNGGQGVARGKIAISDSSGHTDWLDLADPDIQTVDDAIRAVNRLTVSVHAELNETGDGIRIIDTADGANKLTITDTNSTAGADLHLLGESVEVEIDGETRQVVDGSSTFIVELDDEESLVDLLTKINELDAGLHASTFVDGSNKPYRLSLTSQVAGKNGGFVIDVSQLGFELEEMARARDAVLVLGELGAGASSVLISSSSNVFSGAISGVDLEIKQASNSPITVRVESSDVDLMATVQTMVGNYNKFRGRLDELRAWDELTQTGSILTGSAAALRLDTELSYFFSGRIFGAGSIESLGELGISLKQDGQLAFDDSKFRTLFAKDPQAVQQFLATEELGFAAKFEKINEQLTGQDVSMMAHRFITLGKRIDRNEEKIVFMNERLEFDRNRMLLEFYRMELAISKMQSSMSALGSIQAFEPLTTGARSVG